MVANTLDRLSAASSNLEEKEWSSEDEAESPEDQPWSYVPIDPCQPVIMAIRTAMGNTFRFATSTVKPLFYHAKKRSCPDPFALKRFPWNALPPQSFPSIQRPSHPQTELAIQMMAHRNQTTGKAFSSNRCSLFVVVLAMDSRGISRTWRVSARR